VKTWSSNIERYREVVSWECKDIPVDLVLAIINHESGGKAGLQATVKCKSAVLPSVTGTNWTVNHALGLMQVIPPNIVSWNENPNHEQVYVEDMIGDDERAIRLQIRIGCWIFASCVAGLHQFFPTEFPTTSAADATDNHLQCSLCAYAVGTGAVRDKLAELASQGKPLTFKQLGVSFPDWGKNQKTGKWINRPIHYAEIVWNQYAAHSDGTKIDTEAPSLGKKIGKVWNGGGWLLIPAAAALLWAMSGRKGEPK
jgi:hypothetical protein